MQENFDISKIESIIGYTFKDKELLKRAFTLSSASKDNNERLEFFGDAVLEFIVSERLYKTCADREGELTQKRQQIVSDEALKKAVTAMGLEKFLIKSKGDTNNHKAVSSIYEAVLSAIYLDGGMEQARRFVFSTTLESSEKINYVGQLQERLQAEKKPLPEYVCKDIGTVQNPQFECVICLNEHTFKAQANSKQAARTEAAKQAIKKLYGKTQ